MSSGTTLDCNRWERLPAQARDGPVVPIPCIELRMRIGWIVGGPARTEDQTHGRAGGVRRTQTCMGERPMTNRRRTLLIAPGRQADAITWAHQNASLRKDLTWVDVRVSVVTTGTLGRLCFSSDYDNMAAREAAEAKVAADPRWIALGQETQKLIRDGTSPVVPNSIHDEYWRDA